MTVVKTKVQMAHSSPSNEGKLPQGNSADLVPGRKRRREQSPENEPTARVGRPSQELFPVPPVRRLPFFGPPGSGSESDSDSGEESGDSETTDTTAVGSDFEGFAPTVEKSAEEEHTESGDSLSDSLDEWKENTGVADLFSSDSETDDSETDDTEVESEEPEHTEEDWQNSVNYDDDNGDDNGQRGRQRDDNGQDSCDAGADADPYTYFGHDGKPVRGEVWKGETWCGNFGGRDMPAWPLRLQAQEPLVHAYHPPRRTGWDPYTSQHTRFH